MNPTARTPSPPLGEARRLGGPPLGARLRGAAPAKRQRGASLIEVLVAVLILTIGILGMLGLQAASLRNSQSANERSIAAIATHAIIDAMRANRTVALDGGYNFAITPQCTPRQDNNQSDRDINAWITNLQTELGSSACGNINCLQGTCTIQVQWNDERATDGDANFTIETQVRL